MPELPVEGFKRVLAKGALHKAIDRVAVNDARILGKLPARTFISRLQGAELVEAQRHGKHLMAKLDRGGWLTLHFGMTGALQFVRQADAEPPFTRVRLDFAADGSLAYTNKRMIGRVGLVEDAADFIAAEKLGADALDRRFDLDAFKAAVLGSKRDVKSVLMDQQLMAGIGNIYSDEVLRRASLSACLWKCAKSWTRRLRGAPARSSSSSECPRVRFCPSARKEGAARAVDRS